MTGLGSGQVLVFVLVDVVLIVVAARLLGRAARRLGQPTVVGEIIAGVLLGPTLLGLVVTGDLSSTVLACDAALAGTDTVASASSCLFPPQAREVLGILGTLGLLLFMFLVGLEFDTDHVRDHAREVVVVSVGVVAAPLAGGFVIGHVLYTASLVPAFGTAEQPSRLAFQVVVAALLSVTAFPVMAHMLRERGELRTSMATIAMAAAAVATVATFLMVSAATSIAAASTGQLLTRTAGVVVYLGGAWWGVRPLLARLAPTRPSERPTPAVVGLLLVLPVASGVVAEALGITVIVGGFLAGLVLPDRESVHAALAPRLEPVTLVVLLPVFLAFSGLQTDFWLADGETMVAVGVLLVTAVVVKWGAGAAAARLVGMPSGDANAVGILVNCRGLLPLVVAIAALEAGLITPRLQLGAVVMALATTVMTGPLMDRRGPTAVTSPVAATTA